MAEEKIEILVTPERTKPKDGNLRRNSTGRTSTSNSGDKILPHYLRASTNSCHDFCKYGRKHAFEAKGNNPMLKGFTATPAQSQIPVKSVILADRKKKPVVKPKPLPETKTQLPDKPKTVKLKTKTIKQKTNIMNQEALSPFKKIAVPAKPATALKPKPVVAKSSSSPLNSSGGLSSRQNSDSKMANNIRTSKIGEKKALVPPTVSLSPKPSVNRVASLNTRNYSILKAASPLKNQNKVRKAEPRLPNDDQVSEKTLYVIEPKPESQSLGPAQNETHTSQLSSSSSLSSSMLSSAPSPPSLSSAPSPPSLSSHDEDTEEESESILSEEDESVSEYDVTENKDQTGTLKSEYKRRPRRAAMVQPEDKDPPQKLNFRRGKVVNLQTENNGPRRLKFRQGRVLGDNQNGKGDLGRRSFRRRREVGGDNTTESEKVVLKHQDTQGKKDAQGLFNNVIEETASKLVEARKSKVKALVGAFETVISLQDIKPSATSTG